MRRWAAILLAVSVMLFGVACSTESTGQRLAENRTLKDVADELVNRYGFSMPGELTDLLMTDLLEIDLDDVEEYGGYITMAETGTDSLVFVRARQGAAKKIQKALEKRLDYLRCIVDTSLPDRKKKADHGCVVVKGDYAALIIMDQSEGESSGELEKEIKQTYLSYFVS